MRRFWVIFLCAPTALLPSCLPISLDPSLVFEHSADPNVENGTSYEEGTIAVGAAQTIVLPDNAVVRRGGSEGIITLFTGKGLGFMGHPPKCTSIRDARRDMGCAVKLENKTLVIATYGEWSCMEGGASIDLVVVVPKNITVEQRKGLSGDNSLERDKIDFKTTGPAGGWVAIPTVSDFSRTAKRPS
jgi:hypothetical protein